MRVCKVMRWLKLCQCGEELTEQEKVEVRNVRNVAGVAARGYSDRELLDLVARMKGEMRKGR
jgi:hypothetical protein